MNEKDELAERYFAIIEKIIQENENTNTRKSTQDTQ
jgi:hypothetical protein